MARRANLRGSGMPEESDKRIQDQIEALIRDEFGTPLSVEGMAALGRIIRSAEPHPSVATGTENFSDRQVTILLADLRGFTSVSENYPVGVVLDVLNAYFAQMSQIILEHGGTIDKFMGDAIMVLFGAPNARPDDAERAVQCAVRMQLELNRINLVHKQTQRPQLFMGIGINTGSVMAGNLGSELYSEYTVIGDEVNLTSRIETFSLRGQVLISESTYHLCRGLVKTAEPEEVMVKGKTVPVVLHEVLGIPSLDLEVPRQEIRRSPRVEVHIPFAFQLVGDDKSIQETVYKGHLLDISYHGVLAEVETELPARAEMKMEMDLSLIGYQATDVYAKVLKVFPSGERYRLGIEFTSASVQTDVNIHHFIQLLIQGAEVR